MSEMNGYLTLFFLSFGSVLVSCSRFPHRRYHYISTAMTWPDAQQYCRQHYSDLATFESMEEVQQLQPTTAYSWIGLMDDPNSWRGVMGKEPNSWRWSATGDHSQSGYQTWSPNEPNYLDQFETCALMDLDGGWQDKGCSLLYGFVCFTGNPLSPVSYNYINTASTWSQAQTYCRKHHTDLAVIENSTQNTAVYNSISPRASAWIGLYRVPWAWSDNSTSSFKSWKALSPNFPFKQHCAYDSPEHLWDDGGCSASIPVICQTISKLQSFVKVTLKTGADITLPGNNAQILQKVEAELRLRGWTDFRLTWSLKPVKQIPEQV